MRMAILALGATLAGCGITQGTVIDGDFALRFDGDGCVVARGDPELLGLAITVEAWVRGVDQRPDDRGIIVSLGESASLWASPYQTGWGKPSDFTHTGWTTNNVVYDDTERHHIASVWSVDVEGAIFYDGYRTNPDDQGLPWTEVPGYDTIRIGCAKGGVNPFVGVIDEVRVSSTVRYHLTAFEPPTQPFEADGDTIALYHFDLGSGDRALEARDQFPGIIEGATWAPGLLDGYEEDTGW